MASVILKGVRYDRATQWPYGFRLLGHSLQLVVGAGDTLQSARDLIEEAQRVRRQARELPAVVSFPRCYQAREAQTFPLAPLGRSLAAYEPQVKENNPPS